MSDPHRRSLSRAAFLALGLALSLGCRTKDAAEDPVAAPAAGGAQAAEASAAIPPDPDDSDYNRAERARNDRFQDLRQRRYKGTATEAVYDGGQ